MDPVITLKRRPGRPKGARNKPKDGEIRRPLTKAAPGLTSSLANTGGSLSDYHHADPDALVSRQLRMIDTAQRVLVKSMEQNFARPEFNVDHLDITRIEKLSNALVRAIEALKKSSDLADELSKRKTPEQLLEIALKKIEGQNLPTLNYAIKRLRAHRERLAPVAPIDRANMGETATGAGLDLADLTKGDE